MKFKSKVFLAPMADVTEAAFRILCSKYGAGLTYTEMISSTALARNEKNKLFDVKEIEKPIAVQLPLGILSMSSYLKKFVDIDVDLIDFNIELGELNSFKYNSFYDYFNEILKNHKLLKEIKSRI